MGIITAKGLDHDCAEMALHSIQRSLEAERVILPRDFVEIMLDSATPHTDLQPYKSSISYEKWQGDRSTLALSGIGAAHDQWVTASTALFHENYLKQYLFLPLELVGVEEVLRLYSIIAPALEILGLAPDHLHLKATYRGFQQIYWGSNHISCLDDLPSHISKVNYEFIDPSIRLAVKSEKVAGRIAIQVLAKNHHFFLADEDTIRS